MELSVRDYKRAIADGKIDNWSPKDVEQWLHSDIGGIVGQDAACRAASMIIYNHFERRPSVSLFIGPTGCGKTEIWRALRREYSADNVHIIDASTLTAEGWRGSNKISSIFRSIRPDRRGRCILVLDEFDKVLEPQYGAQGTNYSDLIQNQLLRLCDHDTLFFGAGDDSTSALSVDCAGVSVVMLGAFSRLRERKAIGQKHIGFGTAPVPAGDKQTEEITVDDLIEYGMRAELAGRINRIICMDSLTIQGLIRIGKDEADHLSLLLDRPIDIAPDALIMLARIALHKGLGARWMKFKIGTMIDDMIYDNPDAQHYVIEYEPPDADKRRQEEFRTD